MNLSFQAVKRKLMFHIWTTTKFAKVTFSASNGPLIIVYLDFHLFMIFNFGKYCLCPLFPANKADGKINFYPAVLKPVLIYASSLLHHVTETVFVLAGESGLVFGFIMFTGVRLSEAGNINSVFKMLCTFFKKHA